MYFNKKNYLKNNYNYTAIQVESPQFLKYGFALLTNILSSKLSLFHLRFACLIAER